MAPGVDPTMMRAPAAVVTSVLLANPAMMAGQASVPYVPADADLGSIDVTTAVRKSSRIEPRASNVHVSMNDSLAASMTAVPQRRFGVFLAALLIFNAGLATAGVLMMRSALSRNRGSARTTPTVTPTVTPNGEPTGAVDAGVQPASSLVGGKSGPVAKSVDPVSPAAMPAERASTASSAAGALGGAGANVQITPVPGPVAVKSSDKTGTKVPEKSTHGAAGPVDPYATTVPTASPTPTSPPIPTSPPMPTPDGSTGSDGSLPAPAQPGAPTAQEESITDQVRRREVGSRARFARCYATAAKATDTPLVGAVTVAFQITAHGRVSNVSAVDNSTESLSLARCVVAEVSKWTFVADSGAAQDFVRVFKFEGQ